jgi:hypothetical protein
VAACQCLWSCATTAQINHQGESEFGKKLGIEKGRGPRGSSFFKLQSQIKFGHTIYCSGEIYNHAQTDDLS